MEMLEKYVLPIYSCALNENYIITIDELDIVILLEGFDIQDRFKKVNIRFKSVLCSKHTSDRFVINSYNSYDKIVELIDSDWINELKNINKEYFEFWNPNHYAIYLDSEGLFEFIAKGYEVIEYE